ncbi:ral guanine nucleotide dissociation stimulator-like 3 [Eublepharis macularius]|uniref:Ral guanine nucleotide dissociation stimulator-like 3 n=1 Tax=Eublepharis macularius TaxID=481883 RepID=A0AA97KPA0_EUBMA|nr:ral guanine nucleotide dissociation stimulator-like 3 [Eublepharis macularius]
MGKAELAMTPLQQWGEEAEDGAIYSITLQRVKAEAAASGSAHLEDLNLPGCPFVHYRTCKKRTLRAATLPGLVRWLVASGAEGDHGYVPSFLATYQAFATPTQVLDMLLPLGPDNCRAVLRVLELWLQDHPEDFWEPPEHPNLHRTLHFLRQSAQDSPACAAAKGLLQAHKKEEEEYGREATEADEERTQEVLSNCHTGAEIPRVGLPQVTTEAGAHKELPALLSFSVEEVAEQLTLMDSNLFQAVQPFHCLGCVWSQRDKKEKQRAAPSVRATVAQFNAVTSCVTTSVLEDLTLRIPQRAQLMEKWIEIAQRCRDLRNFSSLYAILSALKSNSIYRLKRTWAAVNRNARSSFQKLSQIFSEDNNHLNCREILLQEGGVLGSREGCSSPQVPAGTPLELNSQARRMAPTVPYLGTFLTDLIMLDTALPDSVEGNLINFEKRRKEAETLAVIQQLQESCRGYSFCLNPSFHLAFHGYQKLSEEQSYRISRVIEPPADSCPNSPKLRRGLTKRFGSLLLGSDASATSPGPDRSGISPKGSFSNLHSGDGLGASCSPTQGAPLCKDVPASQGILCPLLQAPPPSPLSKQRGTESRIIRVSVDNVHGNLYRSIVITSQDKAAAVVQRALQKHNLEEASLHNYQLLQRLEGGQELLIPSSANAFYAMNPAGPCDFLLRRKEEGPRPSAMRATQPGSRTTYPTSHNLDTMAATAPAGPTSSSPLLSTTPCPAPTSSSRGVQEPVTLHSSPLPPVLLPHCPPSREPFSPASSNRAAASPLERSQTPASVMQWLPGQLLEALFRPFSPSDWAVPVLSAPQDGESLNGPELLPQSNKDSGP